MRGNLRDVGSGNLRDMRSGSLGDMGSGSLGDMGRRSLRDRRQRDVGLADALLVNGGRGLVVLAGRNQEAENAASEVIDASQPEVGQERFDDIAERQVNLDIGVDETLGLEAEVEEVADLEVNGLLESTLLGERSGGGGGSDAEGSKNVGEGLHFDFGGEVGLGKRV
jgi:hypothetical protein